MINDPIEPYPGAWNQTRPANAPAQDDGDGPTAGGEGDGTGETLTAESAGLATGGVYTGPPIEFEDPPGLAVPPRVVVSDAVPDGEVIVVSGHGPGGSLFDKDGKLAVSAAKITGLATGGVYTGQPIEVEHPAPFIHWPRQNGKTAISEHINALQARIAELEAIVGSVQHYGYAYEVRNPQTGAKQLLDPREVTVILPRERADEFLASWERRALRAEAERAELERQRDAILAIVAREPIDPRQAYADIRKIYGGGQ